MKFYDTDHVAAVGWRAAIDALRTALLDGLDPEAEPPRTSAPFGSGELLTMPSTIGDHAGVKLATIAPDNPARGLPRIHAAYVLFDAGSLEPVATLDGVALTSLRTPAVSALGLDLLAPPEAARLVVFGSGPQAHGHVHALRAVRPVEHVTVIARDPRRTAAFVRLLVDEGVAAEVGDASAVRDADLVACCTTARTPVFAGTDLPDHAVIVACGSHEPTAREVDTETVRRCGVAVEAVSVARREAGDVITALDEGVIAIDDLVPLRALACGETTSRPRLFKTVGMAWQDLAVASAVVS